VRVFSILNHGRVTHGLGLYKTGVGLQGYNLISVKSVYRLRNDRIQQMDIEHAMDGDERVLAGLHLQDSLRRLDELEAFRLELIRRTNIEHKLCVAQIIEFRLSA
jgi:hypothetical protein